MPWSWKLTERVTVGLPTVKLDGLVAVPTAFTTWIGPVVAPVGTVVVISVAELTVNVAVMPLKFTAVALRKFDPVIETDVPARPFVGENELITGGPTVKLVALVPVPAAVWTWMGPVVAPVGTVAVIWVGELTTFVVAAVVLNVTVVALQKPVPVITTLVVPAVPEVGLNDVMVGAVAAVAVKDEALLVAPLSTVTFCAPAETHGTVVVIDVSLTSVNVAVVEPNLTLVTFGVWKFVPVIVTGVPGVPDVTLKLVIVGAAAYAGSAVTKAATTPSASATPTVFPEILTDLPPFRSELRCNLPMPQAILASRNVCVTPYPVGGFPCIELVRHRRVWIGS